MKDELIFPLQSLLVQLAPSKIFSSLNPRFWRAIDFTGYTIAEPGGQNIPIVISNESFYSVWSIWSWCAAMCRSYNQIFWQNSSPTHKCPKTHSNNPRPRIFNSLYTIYNSIIFLTTKIGRNSISNGLSSSSCSGSTACVTGDTSGRGHCGRCCGHDRFRSAFPFWNVETVILSMVFK